MESIWKGMKRDSTRPYVTQFGSSASEAPTQRATSGSRKYSAAESRSPIAASASIVMLKIAFAFFRWASPSSLEIRALAPVPNMSPTYITISRGGKIRFSASKAASPM